MRLYSLGLPIAALIIAAIAASRASAGSPVDPRLVDEVFYHIMPIAYRDSDNDLYRFGDFDGLTASLDYLEDLGVTAIWLNPIFPSPAYHGYQHGRANKVEPRLGNQTEFLNFVAAAKARGIKVYLDFVAYGISHDTVWFEDSYANPASEFDTWMAYTNSANTSYQGYTYSTWNGDSVGFIHWDLRSADAREKVFNWSRLWLDPDKDGDPIDGVAGYRLDHVWVNYGSGPDGWGYNLNDFWLEWRSEIESVNPDVISFAEMADWGDYGESMLTAGAHDATFAIPWMFAARDALQSQNANGLYNETANALNRLPTGKAFLALIGNHDVDRVDSVLGDSLAHARAAAAVLLTQPLPPVIYYGDEIGMLGTKTSSHGSDASDIPMREPFKWNAIAGPPMSNYFVLNANAYNGRVQQNFDGRSVEEQEGVPGSLLESYRDLIAARHAHPALRRGAYAPLPRSSGAVWAFLRQSPCESLVVLINFSGQTRNFTVDLGSYPLIDSATTPIDVLTGTAYPALTTANRFAYPVTLGGYGYAILDAAIFSPNTDLPGDLDLDGLVSSTDLAILLSHFGASGGLQYCDGDLDGSGAVDSSDLAMLLGNFGAGTPGN